jgi:hypothetical protein
MVNGTTTIYVGNYCKKTGSAIRKYYYFAGQRVATVDGNTVYYLVTDHPSASLRTGLRSATAELDQNGARVDEVRYREASRSGVDYHYSGIRSLTDPSTFPTDCRFAGQRIDAYMNLYIML